MPIRKQKSEGLEPGEVITNAIGEIVNPDTGEVLLDAPSSTHIPTVGVNRNIGAFSDDELSSLESWDDVLALIGEKDMKPVDSAEVLGDGYILVDKEKLVDQPMMILDWRICSGDYGEFVAVKAFTKLPVHDVGVGRKVVFIDGSTGICESLMVHGNKLQSFGEGFRPLESRGLRRSDYTYVDPRDGLEKPATTYYIG